MEETLTLHSLTNQSFEVTGVTTHGEGLSTQRSDAANSGPVYQLKQRIDKTAGQQGHVLFRVREVTGKDEEVPVSVSYFGIPLSGQPND